MQASFGSIGELADVIWDRQGDFFWEPISCISIGFGLLQHHLRNRRHALKHALECFDIIWVQLACAKGSIGSLLGTRYQVCS